MKLSEIRGQDAFKVMGRLVGCLREFYTDEKIVQIAKEKKPGWVLNFFETSLEVKSDVWLKLFVALNPDVKEEDVNFGSVVKFASDFINDPEMMSLFFSQGEQTENPSSGSPMVNTEVTEKT